MSTGPAGTTGTAPTKAPAPVPGSTAATGTTATGTAATGTTATTGTYRFTGFTVPDVLTWRDVNKTGVLAGEAIGAWVVLSSTWSLRLFLRLSSYALFFLAIGEYATRILYGSKTGLVASYRPSRFLPDDRQLQHLASTLASQFRGVLTKAGLLVDSRTPSLNIKVAVASYFSYLILGLIPLRILALLAILLTFSVPVAYLQFKPQVDQVITQLLSSAHAHKAKACKLAHDKAGPQINFVKKLAGSRQRGGFPSQGQPNPSYGSGSSTGAATGTTTGASTGHSTGHSSGNAYASSTAPLSTGSSSSATHSSGPSIPAGAPATTSREYATGAQPSIPAPQGSTTAPDASFGTSSNLSGAGTSTLPKEFEQFDSVPTLAGNVSLDKAKIEQFASENLRDSIKNDKKSAL